MHSRGLPKERLLELKGKTPLQKDFEEVKEYVRSKAFNKVVYID